MRWLTVVISNRCDSRCGFCPVDKDVPDLLSIEQIRKIVDWTEKDPPDILQVFGGEPFLFVDHLRELVKARCGEFWIPTNGRPLSASEEPWRFLADHPRVGCTVAIDGTPESHALARPRLALDIPRFLALPNPTAANYAMTRDNLPHFAAGIRFLVEQGFKVIHTNFVREQPYTPDHLRLFRRQLERAADYLLGKNVYVALLDHQNPPGRHYCDLGRGCIGVGSNGRVYLCCVFATFPNALRHEAWLPAGAAAPARRFHLCLGEELGRHGERDYVYPTECDFCDIRDDCWLCPASNYFLTGDLNRVAPWFCDAMRVRAQVKNSYQHRKRALREPAAAATPLLG
ncbi:MAG: radical SAM protein [Planctomycetes bacterium]|nr:radical SAM protein [Planctomycetota bacterium]